MKYALVLPAFLLVSCSQYKGALQEMVVVFLVLHDVSGKRPGGKDLSECDFRAVYLSIQTLQVQTWMGELHKGRS